MTSTHGTPRPGRGGRRRLRRRADMPLLGGVRPPIALLCLLILALAGLTAKVLGPVGEPLVPKEVLKSQQYFAQDGAIALRASVDERVTDLNRTADALNAGKPVEPERVLSDLSRTYQKWTGTTVLDLESGEVLAARGETIPPPPGTACPAPPTAWPAPSRASTSCRSPGSRRRTGPPR